MKQLGRFASLAILVVIVVVLYWTVEPRQLLTAIQGARWQWICLAAFVNVIFNNLARAQRFRTLLEPLTSSSSVPGLVELYRLVLATRALNTVFPARAGETLRALQLHRRHGYHVEQVVAALVVEPVFDVLSLAVPAVVILLAFPPSKLVARQFHLIGAVAAAVVLFAIGLGLLTRHWPIRHGGPVGDHADLSPVKRVSLRLAESLRLLNQSAIWIRAFLWTVVSMAIDLCAVGFCLLAVHLDLGPVAWFTILVVVNVAIALPVTPGSVGMLEAGAVVALSGLGVDQSTAFAFAVFYHTVHLVPDTLVGAFFLHKQWP